MTTAREALAKQLHDMMKGSPPAEAQAKVGELLDQYRVQAKPGTEVKQGVTAREGLGKDLVALWKRAPKDMERSVEALLDKYRMQLKKESDPVQRAEKVIAPRAAAPAAAPAGKAAARPAAAPTASGKAVARPTPAAAPARATAPVSPLPPPRPVSSSPAPIAPRAAPQSVTPLFPGTPTGPSRRSECPKCKSRGVVLARSYTQEEFFSCIYCGWQAFKPFEEANQDSPLAARLMAQRPSLPKRKDEPAEEGGKRAGGLFMDDDDEGRRRSVIADDEMPATGPAMVPADTEDGDNEMERAGMHEVDDLDADAEDGLDSLDED
ncbi:MAG: hypothetical protein HY904_16375 [Deltaproteobacteria bacterium]|nr:hypothetical protein [Deltaproteobacteria bacterium]